ncbi:hypothetical protein ASD65_15350 [Microbacterium sp. Root61]|uniref:LPXTG cell wall anchor domain-containing protein n=1 Tax=Microbacterium sp. Root61 TaxID=1736570 RepID=UPI0006FBC3FC|nr:LPXTG cell wall anchor domain-containing protein [Microbacterium sp. Root61]KRA25640.1 hypothetical protein ASD65_15350 [Microbacterium sp. Root61]
MAGTPTQNPDASWNISYTITVKNPGASPISATLTDAFPATPAGWTLAGGVWNIAAQGGAPITNTTSAASPIWSGTLPANTTYTYIVSGKLTPTAGATPIGDCQTQGKGLTNTATVTSGSVSDTSGDCVSIVTPPVTVTKTDGTVSQLVDGTWQIDYTVTVTNGGTQATVYTLTDTPDLGTGFTLVSGTWFGPAPVANTPIEGGGFDQYVYRVIASFNPATPDPELTCDTTNGGAFFNKALVTFPGGTDDDTGCGEPESPTVEKSASAATQAPGGEWTLTYTVTVDNTSEMALAYTASDTPAALPAGVTLTTPWAVTGPAALNGGTATLTPGWTGTAPNTQFATGHLLAGTAHTYTVKAGVTLSAGVTPATLTCGQTPGGNGFWNSATVTNGVGTSDDSACVTVPFDDVGIVKTTEGVDGPVESDGVFKYVLTVTNHGTRAATNVKVTDPVPSRLTVTGIDLTDATGWTNDNDPDFVGEGNTVDLTGPVSFGVGATAEIVLTVKVNPVPVPEIPNLNEGDPVPTPELPMSTLVNEACVSADMDSVPGNDCDSVTVETKDIAAIVYTRCVGDAPLIGFVVAKTPNLAALPVDFTWTPNSPEPDTDPAEVAKQYPGGTATVSDEFAWVGTAFTPSGVSLDYPGWRALQASDYAPGGGYYIPGTTDVMTPTDEEEMIFNGLILDPSELDYAWRDTTTVVLSVNPSMTFTVEYPDATPECFVARHTEVQIEKTASVEKTDPGKSFTYTLAAANVSDDSAADGVVVTDTIPADLKITDVSWTGKGDANVFPNWSTCAVSGQNGAGYGGTLTCELFGPLQPAGSGLGASAAPTITLSATVNASSKASVITNVGVVDYYTFGDPTDTGRDADDAVVLLSGLPATGGSALTPLILLGFLALLGGTATIVMIRRRRGSTKPQL